MKTSSPLTKFSSRMDIMVVDDNNNDANPIVHVVHDDDDDDDDDDEQDEGGGSNNDNRSCMVGEDAYSTVNSIQKSLNGAHGSGADVVATSASVASARIVTPDKRDHDPEIDIYPSDGSLSTLSLGTEDCRSTDDEDADNRERYCTATKQNQQPQQEQQHQQQQDYQQQDHVRQEQQQQQEQPQHKQLDAIPSNQNYNFLSDGYSSEDSELSAVIAGVQKLNRKTSGKITPLNKRRRRKRRSTGSGNGQSSSGSMSASSFSSRGSLLDEVIVEEGELNSSNEGMAAAMIVNANEGGVGKYRNTVDLSVPIWPSASGNDEASTAKKKGQCRRKNGNSISNEDGCGSINSDGSSNTVDSNISRAARGRRHRISTQRQSRIDPDGEYDSSSLFSRPASPGDIPEPHNLHQSNVRKDGNHRGINNRPTPIARVHCNSNMEQQNAWQARRIRMKRLRMITTLW